MTKHRGSETDGSAVPRVVQSVARAAVLLKVMAARGQPMGLSDLAGSIGISKPATFHLLKTLELEGFVSKGEDALYRLDWGLYELGGAVIRSVNLTQVARMHLDRLADQTGEAVLLSILDDSSVLYLDRGQSAESFAMVANIGRRSPLHTNASGKILLAYKELGFVAQFFAEPLRANTAATICDPTQLQAQLAQARREGYATCWQEQEPGLCSVAAPIFDYTGLACAAIAVAGPAERVCVDALPVLVPQLQGEAHAISRKLGWLES